MNRIYVTLGSRVAKPDISPEDRGELVILDWDSKSIVRTISVDTDKLVEEGRSRGVAGIEWFDNKIYVVCRNEVVCFDPDTFNEVRRIDLDLYKGAHDIKSDGELLWVTVDKPKTLKVGIDGEKIVDVKRTYVKDERSGFPAIGFIDEREFHMFTGPEEIYDVRNQEVLTDMIGTGAHDLCFLDENFLLFTRSIEREIILVNMNNGRQERVIKMKKIKQDTDDPYSYRGFLRGLAFDSKSRSLFATTGPGTIYKIDTDMWTIVDSWNFYDEKPLYHLKQCPFGLLLDPRDW